MNQILTLSPRSRAIFLKEASIDLPSQINITNLKTHLHLKENDKIINSILYGPGLDQKNNFISGEESQSLLYRSQNSSLRKEKEWGLFKDAFWDIPKRLQEFTQDTGESLLHLDSTLHQGWQQILGEDHDNLIALGKAGTYGGGIVLGALGLAVSCVFLPAVLGGYSLYQLGRTSLDAGDKITQPLFHDFTHAAQAKKEIQSSAYASFDQSLLIALFLIPSPKSWSVTKNLFQSLKLPIEGGLEFLLNLRLPQINRWVLQSNTPLEAFLAAEEAPSLLTLLSQRLKNGSHTMGAPNSTQATVPLNERPGCWNSFLEFIGMKKRPPQLRQANQRQMQAPQTRQPHVQQPPRQNHAAADFPADDTSHTLLLGEEQGRGSHTIAYDDSLNSRSSMTMAYDDASRNGRYGHFDGLIQEGDEIYHAAQTEMWELLNQQGTYVGDEAMNLVKTNLDRLKEQPFRLALAKKLAGFITYLKTNEEFLLQSCFGSRQTIEASWKNTFNEVYVFLDSLKETQRKSLMKRYKDLFQHQADKTFNPNNPQVQQFVEDFTAWQTLLSEAEKATSYHYKFIYETLKAKGLVR